MRGGGGWYGDPRDTCSISPGTAARQKDYSPDAGALLDSGTLPSARNTRQRPEYTQQSPLGEASDGVPYLYRRPALGKEAFAECRVLALGNCAVFGSGAQRVVTRGNGRHGGIGSGRSIDNASCPGCGWGRNL